MMTTKEFEVIKQKLEKIKESKARAEGALEKLKQQLKKDFEVDTVEAANLLLEDLESKIEKDDERLDTLSDELHNIIDWENV